MESRVAALEIATAKVQTTLERIDWSLAQVLSNAPSKSDITALQGSLNALQQRLEGGIISFASKVEGDLKAFGSKLDGGLTAVGAEMKGQEKRLGLVETAIDRVGIKLDAKMISGGQMFTIFGGLLGLFFVFGGIAIEVLKYLEMLR